MGVKKKITQRGRINWYSDILKRANLSIHDFGSSNVTPSGETSTGIKGYREQKTDDEHIKKSDRQSSR